jgi:sulfur-oxidizing protein SoxX
MRIKIKYLAYATLFLSLSTSTIAADLTKAYDMPDATKMIEKDLMPGATEFTLPKTCNLTDAASIARGEFMFHNLNGKKAKGKLPEGLAKFVEKTGKDGKVKKKSKQYGNCIACHDIEGSKGAGNIGPSLVSYKAMFLDTKVRDAQFVYQKIADPRVDNANTHMTINLTTKLFNEQEICDYTAYVMADRSKK